MNEVKCEVHNKNINITLFQLTQDNIYIFIKKLNNIYIFIHLISHPRIKRNLEKNNNSSIFSFSHPSIESSENINKRTEPKFLEGTPFFSSLHNLNSSSFTMSIRA